jgi:holo-[acyl-carrier protein] synthase
MIYGIGVDIIDSNRIKQSKFDLDRFAKHLLTTREKAIFKKSKNKLAFISKRWASKEAISKAVGQGITSLIHWQNIEITNDQHGKPVVEFIGPLSKNLKGNCRLSISDESNFCVAFAILELE